METAAQREAGAVRKGVGVLDGSPLGKIEVYGPDAALFLDLMYVGTMSTLTLGQARYGLLLNENGIVVDDGIVARLGVQHFWVNTTSAGVERTAAAFEEWLQCEYAESAGAHHSGHLSLGKCDGGGTARVGLAGVGRIRSRALAPGR